MDALQQSGLTARSKILEEQFNTLINKRAARKE
jgi:hypothetical protein